MYKSCRFVVCLSLISACGGGDSVAPSLAADAGLDAGHDGGHQDGHQGGTDAGADAKRDAQPVDASALRSDASNEGGLPGCDLSGVWLARMTTQSTALLVPQFANNWYYYEFAQHGGELVVARHIDCGVEVRGTVRVNLAKETTVALTKHNQQVGRLARVTPQDDGTCAFAMEQFWSVRGVSEQQYVPAPRNVASSIEDVRSSLPLPTRDMASLSEDWDNDGKPGIAWLVSGIVSGVRHTAQRDWTRFFTTASFPIRAGDDFPEDLLIRAEFSNEEVVFEADLGLDQLSQPEASAPHTLTLRFLGRTLEDPRAKAVRVPDDYQTCLNIQSALPSVQALPTVQAPK